MSRLPKIECDACGRAHDVRKDKIGLCARCEARENETTQNWTPEAFLASIENAGVRGSYGSYLNSVARLLGAANRRSIDWSAVTESAVVQATRDEAKASSLCSATRGLLTWCAINQPAPESTGCYFVPVAVPADPETPHVLRDGIHLRLTRDRDFWTKFSTEARELDAFELEFLA